MDAPAPMLQRVPLREEPVAFQQDLRTNSVIDDDNGDGDDDDEEEEEEED